MATQAKIVIKGQNNVSQAAKSAANDLTGLKDSISKLGSAIKTSLSVAAVIGSVKALGNACKTVLLKDFNDTNNAYKQLALALKDKTSYDAAVANIDRLAKITSASNYDIEAMVAELAALGKSGDEINKISEAAVHLSNITGKDLNSSMTTLLNTYNGTTTQLKRLGLNLEGITKEELSQGAAIDVVIEKFAEYSKELANEDSGQHLKNISETWGDIKEKIGGIIDYNIGGFIERFDIAFEDIGKRINSITVYTGAIIKNFPEVFQLLMSTLWTMVKKTFEWDSIKTIFTTAIETIGKVGVATLKAVFQTIPEMLAASLGGVLQWIAYIAMNIEASILGAIESVINKAGEKIQGTWIGKLFGLADKLESFDLGSERIKEASKTVKAGADASFESLGPMFKNAIKDAIALEADVANDYKEAAADIYGDIGKGFKDSVNALVTPYLAEIEAHSNANNQGRILSRIESNTSDTADNTENDGTDTVPAAVEKSFRSLPARLSDMLADKISALLPNTATGGLGGILSEDLRSGIGGIVSAMAPLMNIATGFISPSSALLIVLKGFVSVMEPALTTVVQPIMDVLSWIGETLGTLLLPILDRLYVVFALTANIIRAVFAPVLQAISPAIQTVSALFEMLSPILVLVAKAFTLVMAPVQFVADMLSWLGQWITYCGHAVATFCHNITHPFSQRSYGDSPGGFTSTAFSGLADRLAAIDGTAQSGSAATDSVSTGTAVSSASYSGSTHVTINVYQQSPVVGDGGMRAFARMIKSEFLALDYYGVTS